MVRTVTQSLQEYGRGIVGGLLFSMPLLYTMEVWWAGFLLSPARLAAGLLATFVLLLGYNRYAGLRHDAGLAEIAIDSVEELGLGLLVAAMLLWLLGRITGGMPAGEVVGKIVAEAIVVSIGVSVGTAQLGGTGGGAGPRHDQNRSSGFGGQLVLTTCGGVLLAANVAPTDEIGIIASETALWKLVALVPLSLALSALILFYSDFVGTADLGIGSGFPAALFWSVITYAVALAVSAAVLWFFGRFDGADLPMVLAQTVVLGFTATLGASAGRVLLR